MKKLLLIILVLFGILNIQSLANGCSAQICTCPNGGYVTTGQYCPTYNNTYNTPPSTPPANFYHFIFTLDNKTYKLIDLKTTDVIKAIKIGCNRPAQNCSLITKREYLAVVISEDNRIFTGSSDTFYKGTAKQAEKSALKDCREGKEANGNGVLGDGVKGKKCKLIMLLSPNFKLQDKRDNQTYDLKVTGSL